MLFLFRRYFFLICIFGLSVVSAVTICLFSTFFYYSKFADQHFDNIDSETKNYSYNYSLGNLLYFIHISDIHVSIFRDPARIPDFKRFLSNELPNIKPELVVVSGDLTDAKLPKRQTSQQYEKEWQIYQSLLMEFQVDKNTHWLDIRGNHDAFNIPYAGAGRYFQKYSKRASTLGLSYHYLVNKKFGNYSFISMDAVPPVGPKRPYNFFGTITEGDILNLQTFGKESKRSNQTFIFGHYPISIIVHNDFPLRSFIGSTSYAYLCGHLHTLGGLMPKMHTLHPEGFLELEVGDWMDNRIYRIVSIDNDLVSFSDVRLDTWPLVHIANPKSSSYLQPGKEPTQRILSSSHITVLVFSLSPIKYVTVYLDGHYYGNASKVSSIRGLYAIPWKPDKIFGNTVSNEHFIQVTVIDSEHRQNTAQHYFNVQGIARWRFPFISSLLLLSNLSNVLKLAFMMTWLMLVLPVIFTKFAFTVNSFHCQTNTLQLSIIIGFYRFVQSKSLCYLWIGYFVYLVTGPIMFGYFLDEHFGCLFLSGIYVDGHWIPESFIYVTECIQLMAFHCPLLVLLCWRLRPRANVHPSQIPLYVLLLWQLYLSYINLYDSYGFSVFMLSPCRLWQIPFAWLLHRLAELNHLSLAS